MITCAHAYKKNDMIKWKKMMKPSDDMISVRATVIQCSIRPHKLFFDTPEKCEY